MASHICDRCGLDVYYYRDEDSNLIFSGRCFDHLKDHFYYSIPHARNHLALLEEYLSVMTRPDILDSDFEMMIDMIKDFEP